MDGWGVLDATSVERLEIELLFRLLWNGSYSSSGTGILLWVEVIKDGSIAFLNAASWCGSVGWLACSPLLLAAVAAAFFSPPHLPPSSPSPSPSPPPPPPPSPSHSPLGDIRLSPSPTISPSSSLVVT